AAVLLAPLQWSLAPVLTRGNPVIPVADPLLLAGTLAPEVVDPADIRPLADFLLAHRRGERYFLASANLMVAALIIVETGQPVIPTAGFMGKAFITPARFADMVAKREVRYALLMPVSSPSAHTGGSDWAPGGARIVSPALWRPGFPGSNIAMPADDRP